MQIQPRQELLDVWRATVRQSYPDGAWRFGGRDGTNSISDAEQLLCLMGPATEIPIFRLDNPDAANRDVLDAIGALGDDLQVPQRLLAALTEYLERYTAPDGTPDFSGGSYFRPELAGEEVKIEQHGLDVVD